MHNKSRNTIRKVKCVKYALCYFKTLFYMSVEFVDTKCSLLLHSVPVTVDVESTAVIAIALWSRCLQRVTLLLQITVMPGPVLSQGIEKHKQTLSLSLTAGMLHKALQQHASLDWLQVCSLSSDQQPKEDEVQVRKPA